MRHRSVTLCLLFASAVMLCGCKHLAAPTPAIHNFPPINDTAYIKHVVVIVQENRSFDNLFKGFPGADTSPSGVAQPGRSVPLLPVPLEAGIDVGHSHLNWVTAYDNGLLDDFDAQGEFDLSGGVYAPIAPPYEDYPYAYVPTAEVQPYWQLAAKYTLGDRMFQSNTGPSFVAHQYLIAGQSAFMAETPDSNLWGCDAPAGTTVAVLDQNGNEQLGPFPCQNYTTLGDELDAKGISWRYYAPAVGTVGYVWSAYDVVSHIRFGTDWTRNVISPESTVLNDIANNTLPQMSWVIPSLPNSDHALSKSNTGPQWVASIVNALGASQYWKDTAIIIIWDDWGGWYDHVVPPHRDVMGDGFRVPLMIVSPYAKHGYVSHQTHDFGSLVRFVQDTFGLPRLGFNDLQADSLNDCFDFTQVVTPLEQVPVRLSKSFFLTQKRSDQPPDNE